MVGVVGSRPGALRGIDGVDEVAVGFVWRMKQPTGGRGRRRCGERWRGSCEFGFVAT